MYIRIISLCMHSVSSFIIVMWAYLPPLTESQEQINSYLCHNACGAGRQLLSSEVSSVECCNMLGAGGYSISGPRAGVESCQMCTSMLFLMPHIRGFHTDF